jgi:hypothetical protein
MAAAPVSSRVRLKTARYETISDISNCRMRAAAARRVQIAWRKSQAAGSIAPCALETDDRARWHAQRYQSLNYCVGRIEKHLS